MAQEIITQRDPVRRREIPALTGLRFAAALSVLIAHGVSVTITGDDPVTGPLSWLTTASGFGMTLFFVLSGFVIHYNYAALVTGGGLRGVGLFFWARFARLYPLFLLMLGVYVAVSQRTVAYWTGHPESIKPLLQALPYFLFSIQSWIYKVVGDSSLIIAIRGGSPPTWSISTEWFFYVIYPFAAWLILRARTATLVAFVIFLWCALWMNFAIYLYDRSAGIEAWAVGHFGPIAASQNPNDSFVHWLLYLSPYLRLGEFVLGALTAQLYACVDRCPVTRRENILGGVILFCSILGLLAINYANYSPHVPMNIFRKMSQNFAMAPAIAILIFCAARYRTLVSRLLTLRPVIALGEASYSIYLVHSLVLISAVKLNVDAGHGDLYKFVVLAALMAITICISLLLYSYYEVPARKWLRRQAGGRLGHDAVGFGAAYGPTPAGPSATPSDA